ncbi:hypothetical protein [Listeria booriae]|uniref:hypothetical protein n=1 Tax=Listeria booriae TaxID=1552123 RepID=UPI001624D7D5|nr:hypothetical protein [Listeria booriae]MBC1798862.1 hypothetical protein [Listeria booriae]MBC2036138.1 hypothetical protein [Listeria booriae]MBC2147265.1 hypothetical protein [Listeria booriae]
MKKETLKQQSIYVHMDSVINNVVTSGITFCDFMNGVMSPPQNILLLKHQFQDASFNAHTSFHYTDVRDLAELKKAPVSQYGDFCWVDFEDLDLVNQLTAQEVAELLYLAHTGRHLRSPFYYKLQNNFVYLTMNDGRYNKVYYRNLDQFYHVLAYAIWKNMMQLTTEKIALPFMKRKKIADIPVALLKKFATYFKEGVCISFDDAVKTRNQIEVPIGYHLQDDMQELLRSNELIGYDRVVAHLNYDMKKNEWLLIEE